MNVVAGKRRGLIQNEGSEVPGAVAGGASKAGLTEPEIYTTLPRSMTYRYAEIGPHGTYNTTHERRALEADSRSLKVASLNARSSPVTKARKPLAKAPKSTGLIAG